jgi:hypothetical protein
MASDGIGCRQYDWVEASTVIFSHNIKNYCVVRLSAIKGKPITNFIVLF